MADFSLTTSQLAEAKIWLSFEFGEDKLLSTDNDEVSSTFCVFRGLGNGSRPLVFTNNLRRRYRQTGVWDQDFSPISLAVWAEDMAEADDDRALDIAYAIAERECDLVTPDEVTDRLRGVYNRLRDYAIEEAGELGIDTDMWPYNCIDWDQAGDMLAEDNMTVSLPSGEVAVLSN